MRIRKGAVAAGKEAPKVSVAREVVEWVVTLAVAVGLALCVHAWVGELITVSGPSMQPNLWDYEKVLVGKLEYDFSKPKRGDIVIVKFPDRTEDIIKRVIATEGERISVSGGSVYINGSRLDEPYILEPVIGDMAEQIVPPGTIFVMGDNRNDSHDSRAVGPIALDKVIGRAYAIVWPTDKWAKLTGYNGTLLK
jgi:signal peptidase I